MESSALVRIVSVDVRKQSFQTLSEFVRKLTSTHPPLVDCVVDHIDSPSREALRSSEGDIIFISPEAVESLGLSWLEDTCRGEDFPPVVLFSASEKTRTIACDDVGAIAYFERGELDEYSFIVLLRVAQKFQSTRRALAESRTRFHRAVECLGDGIVITNRQGRITFVNSVMTDITGYQAYEMVGKYVHELFYPSGDLHSSARVEEMKRRYRNRLQGFTENYETQITRKDGSVRWVSVHAAPLRNPKGEIMGAIGVNRDVTEKKDLEQQLRWSQQMEAVGRLAGGIAHDFNNLLTAIFGYADMLLKRMTEENEHRREIEIIRKASEAACTLTQQLLSISRRRVSQPVAVNLNEAVQDSTRIMHGMLGTNVELITNLRPHISNVMADPGQIHQIIMNLAINGRDAMPDGGTLTIETEETFVTGRREEGTVRLRPGFYVVLTVSDTGFGMDERVKAHLFEPFFTTKKDTGTGLGLSTICGIVEQLQGEIVVRSEEGRGATFRIFLPCCTALIKGSEEEQPAIDQYRGTESIVLVEDDAIVRALAREVLEGQGYTVREAKDGQEALALLQTFSDFPDLVLTDVVMPNVNGLELSRQLLGRKPDLKIIVMSGYTDGSTIPENVLKTGIPFIEKPFTPAKLSRKIREVLDAGKPGRQAQASSS